MTAHDWIRGARLSIAACSVLFSAQVVFGQTPPVLTTVFPMGGQAGTTVDVTVGGSNLESLTSLQCTIPGIQCEKLDASSFRLTIPAETLPGLYDLWAIGSNGVSAIRTFTTGRRAEQLEVEPNDSVSTAMPVPSDVVINGQIDKPADADHFQFDAKQGQRVVIECRAERIDSPLRAVLEVFNTSGRRLAVNRGYYGIDPLIEFSVPADSSYIVKVQDLVLSGSTEHTYRLDIDTGPRVAFSFPSVIERGKASRIALYGWNLQEQNTRRTSSDVANVTDSSSAAPADVEKSAFDRVEIEIPAALAEPSWPLLVSLQPAQTVLEGAAFAYHFAGSAAPVVIGLSDVPVVLDGTSNHSPTSAQDIMVPCEVSGQLAAGDECDFFAVRVLRGEVFYIEALGQRMNSPVDLQISLLEAKDQTQVSQRTPNGVFEQDQTTSVSTQEHAQFNDEVQNVGGRFSTNHLDPAGRWVCPADGRYLIAVRNLTGGLQADPRRNYRLSVRREEPDFRLVVVPHRDDRTGLNVQRGGRETLDLLAFRRRGMEGPIRVSAINLLPGIECPDVWLGPGVDRANVVVSANENAEQVSGELRLQGVSEDAAMSISRTVSSGVIVRSGTPEEKGRFTSQLPVAISGEAPLRITANAHEPLEHHLYGTLQVKHSPGSILDVAVNIERRNPAHQAPVRLTGVELPALIANQATVIPAGQFKGYLSFFLPPTLPLGPYSIVIRAETTVMALDKKTETVLVQSNPVTFEVQPAAFLIEVDPFAVTQARRGETIQIGYSAQRINGFIGKMHTELAVPGQITDVVGLRGRGETFVGQTEKGSLQIVVNDDAPLGALHFLRLFTVGVLEDQPAYFGSRFISLEIVE